MGITTDLLQQARHLAIYQGVNATQSDLRRAVSTAYYALFHLLVEDCGRRWQGGSASSETGLQRALNHGPMNQCSQQFKGPQWRDWHGSLQLVPPEIRRVAQAFIDLQEERQLADYDNQLEWTISDVQSVLETATSAVQDWLSIRANPMAGDYLLSMVLGKRR